MDQAIVAGLEKSPYQIELYSEDLEATLFPDKDSQERFQEWYIRKYRDRRPDVIITVGPDPLKFMVESHEKSFSGIPIIFCGSTQEMFGKLQLDSHFTGVWGVAQPGNTLDAALHLQPGTQHVIVVGGVGEYDRYLEAIVKDMFRKYESSLEFTYLTDLDMPSLLERLKHLPSHTIVYYTSIMQDAVGARFIDASQSVPLVAGAANAPVFVVDDVDVGRGTVGGDVLSFAAEGQTAAAMAVKVLGGEKPQDIPIVKSANIYLFDWRALRRWRLRESDLPPGSVMLYRQPTVWESYRRYILAGSSLILAEALLIFGLVWQRARRRKVEAELATTYERLRLAVEAGKAVGWDWDVGSGRDRWFGDLETMFGIPSDTYSGHFEDFRRRIHPADREIVWNAIADARESRKPYTEEFRIVRTDGSVRWITARGEFYYGNNEAARMLGMAVDITNRKQTEEKLHASEERLAGIVASAMDAIIAIDQDQRIVLFNVAAEKMFGCTVAEAAGTAIDRFIPQRFRAAHEGHIRRFGTSGVTNRAMGALAALWAVRANGQEFPIEASISQTEADGRKLFTVIIRDITERRMAEQALTSLSGRLIEAQEEERRRIAREIHDDYNQRLAMVASDLEGLAEYLGHSPAEAGQRLHELWNRVSELGADLHSLSHRLHSSTLESLGLVAGVRALCSELADQQGMQVDFAHENVPRGIPGDAALCLFRIAQEGLRNVKRHSGASRAEVRLEWIGEKLHLSVSDRGRGFDSRVRSAQAGIGIRSMEERLRLVGGHLEIHSRPQEGTRIDAWLPFKVAGHRVG